MLRLLKHQNWSSPDFLITLLFVPIHDIVSKKTEETLSKILLPNKEIPS